MKRVIGLSLSVFGVRRIWPVGSPRFILFTFHLEANDERRSTTSTVNFILILAH